MHFVRNQNKPKVQHAWKENKEIESTISLWDKNLTDYSYNCAFCHAEVNGEAKFKIHIESKLFEFLCVICGFNAEGPRLLREHVEKVHVREAKIDDIASRSPISDVSVDDWCNQLIKEDTLEQVDEPQIKSKVHPPAKNANDNQDNTCQVPW